MSADDLPARRPPRDCPVCAHELVLTGLGCPQCGTGLSGAFRQCRFCGLSPADLDMLAVFLVSRGNMRDLAAHLQVSYPTARARYGDLLHRLGLAEPQAAADRPPGDHAEAVLADLAAGRIDVDEAERLLRGPTGPTGPAGPAAGPGPATGLAPEPGAG